MSLVPRSLRKMRIIAVPLTRPKLSSQNRTDPRHGLTYYQFQLSSPKPAFLNKAVVGTRVKSRWLPEEGVVNFLQLKAAEIWAGFGRAEKGSWKLKAYQTGEHLMDRIEFEELALKGLDPSLGPSLAQSSKVLEKGPRIPLIYPSSLSSDSESLLHLQTLLEHRMPQHRKGFYLWMIIAPLTAPFMIVPIIPNLPFFFCVWRSWSHYKAYRATQYLQDLLVNKCIVPEGSEALDAIFKQCSAPVFSVSEETQAGSQRTSRSKSHEFLLKKEAVPAVIRLFDLKESANVDLCRAIEQARLRIENKRPDSS